MGVLVCHQRHLDSKRLRTELALIRFLPRVDTLVLLEFGLVLEAFLTVAAAVWSLFRVTQHVCLQVSPPSTGFATVVTFIWFLPSVDQLVLLQTARSPKLPPTHLAAVRSLPRMGEEVLSEGVQQVEFFIAVLAGMTSLSWSLF